MILHNEERILDFLDGRLGSDAEEELLHTLAVSPERRQLLREHLRLRELTGSLTQQQHYNVPTYVTAGLFSQLATMGFTAPSSVNDVLTKAPELAKVRQEQLSLEDRAGTGGFTLGHGRMGSVMMACLISFMLGLGAFYVFGSNIGLRTLSQQRSLIAANPHHPMLKGSVVHQQFDLANAEQSVVSTPRLSIPHESVGPSKNALTLASIPEVAIPVIGALPRAEFVPTESFKTIPIDPIPMTEPKPSYGRDITIPGTLMPFSMPLHSNRSQYPLLDEKGTISFRFGTGRAPGNTTAQWSSLSELKFTWTLNDYLIGRASLGQFISWEREADTKPTQIGPKSWAIDVNPVRHLIPVAGGELGLILDPIDIPVEISAGFMADGSGRIYPRGAVIGHFELFDLVNVGLGVEGMVTSHDVGSTVSDSKALLKDYHPTVASNTPESEKIGFVGLALELGWRF